MKLKLRKNRVVSLWIGSMICLLTFQPLYVSAEDSITDRSQENLSPMTRRYMQYGKIHGTQTLLQAGIDSLAANEYHTARFAFDALLLLDEKSVEAAYYLGKIAYEGRNPAKAREYFRMAYQWLEPEAEAGNAEATPLSLTSGTNRVTSSGVYPPDNPHITRSADSRTQMTALQPATASQSSWVSVTGKPLQHVGTDTLNQPALVKLVDPGITIFTQDGWGLSPRNGLRGLDAVYTLSPGKVYRLQKVSPHQSNTPIYLGALGAIVAVLLLVQ